MPSSASISARRVRWRSPPACASRSSTSAERRSASESRHSIGQRFALATRRFERRVGLRHAARSVSNRSRRAVVCCVKLPISASHLLARGARALAILIEMMPSARFRAVALGREAGEALAQIAGKPGGLRLHRFRLRDALRAPARVPLPDARDRRRSARLRAARLRVALALARLRRRCRATPRPHARAARVRPACARFPTPTSAISARSSASIISALPSARFRCVALADRTIRSRAWLRARRLSSRFRLRAHLRQLFAQRLRLHAAGEDRLLALIPPAGDRAAAGDLLAGERDDGIAQTAVRVRERCRSAACRRPARCPPETRTMPRTGAACESAYARSR